MQIEVKNLTFIYNESTAFSKRALDNISFSVEKGEFIGIIGHTGSGKSTLIQHLNSLTKPTEGHVFIDGADINADKNILKSVRQKVGLVFQYPEHQLFETTVFKDVAFGPKNQGLSDAVVKERVEWALKVVNISEEHYELSPFELSGGQKRRVAIAGVLAMKPEVLILDEPTAGLDPRGREEILQEIKKMREELGITIILVSHSMEDIARYVTRIIVMNNGRLEIDGRPDEIFSEPERLEAMGLAAPQICYLMREMQRRGYPVRTDVFTVEDAVESLFGLWEKK